MAAMVRLQRLRTDLDPARPRRGLASLAEGKGNPLTGANFRSLAPVYIDDDIAA